MQSNWSTRVQYLAYLLNSWFEYCTLGQKTQAHTHTQRQRDRETERETERHRQTDRQTYRERERTLICSIILISHIAQLFNHLRCPMMGEVSLET